MESPQQVIHIQDKKYAQMLKQTGGIGTVATRQILLKNFSILMQLNQQMERLRSHLKDNKY